VVALATSVADAAALAKFKDWCHWPTTDPIPVYENPNVDGVAVLRYKETTGVVTVSLALHNLLPNTDYAIMLNGNNVFVIWGEAAVQMRTDEDGSGHFIGEMTNPEAPDAPELYVLRVPPGGTENWEHPEDWIRASAIPEVR
jgi:hypothetical protein